ncbi:hypothetical protein H920_04227 [Fukomys damarensis]|uniref:Uncharacterized protein n=1 Tax=Fukomys damarensis TaxID=885580 RepID=A0A091DQE3_FUKDA|nr:hypothetical protein H920_04227 [Fukomys damarensis]
MWSVLRHVHTGLKSACLPFLTIGPLPCFCQNLDSSGMVFSFQMHQVFPDLERSSAGLSSGCTRTPAGTQEALLC